MQYSAKISDFAIFKHSISPQGRICSVECNKRVLFSVAGGVALVRNIKMSSVQTLLIIYFSIIGIIISSDTSKR